MLLVDSIAEHSVALDLDAMATFKACVTYAIDLAWTNADKAEFLRLCEEGWDLRMAEIEKRRPKGEP